MRRAIVVAVCSGAVVGAMVGLTVGPPIMRSTPSQEAAHNTPMRIGARSEDPACHCDHCNVELERMQQDLALTRRLLDDLRGDLEGVPIPWSSDIEERFRESAFRDIMAEVADMCPEAAPVAIDCGEPPCIAAFEVPLDERAGALTTCPPWRNNYNEGYTSSILQTSCGGAALRKTALVSPLPDVVFQSTDGMDDGNLEKRLRFRRQSINEMLCD